MWFGVTVSARSVRLLSIKTTERDSWWSELREEIMKNALSLNCTHILGYREIASIYEDVIIMHVFGTAVKIKEKVLPQQFDSKIHKYKRSNTPKDLSPI